VIRLSQLRPPAVSGIFLSLLLPIAAHAQTDTATAAKAARTPVLVELFTAEGCSSCPPADVLLGKLQQLQPVQGADIIILGEHVDYWDKDGWQDRFSSHDFTDRQTVYAAKLHVTSGDYTPQMIVDGSEQFLGSDPQHALKSITTAAETPKVPLTLTNLTVNGRKVSGSVSAPPFPFKGDLYAVLVDPTDSTDVKRGENGGKHLDHAGVVRTMQRIGSLKDLASGPRAFTLSAPSNATPASMRLVVFAQRSDEGPVVAAVSTPVTPVTP
jgi:hypothetical protein